MTALVEVYRGSVQTWECDQMGHMNVQFYLEKSACALTVLGQLLGLGPARAGAARLVAREHHVRFLREQRAGAPLYLVSGILAVSEQELRVYQELRNSANDEVAATFIVEAELEGDDESLPLPAAVQQAARALGCSLPPHGAPRGLELHPPRTAPKLQQAEALGMLRTYLGPVLPQMCDVDGALAVRNYMGIISDAVPNLVAHTRGEPAAGNRRLGGAALEYRLVYRRRPRAGEVLALYSGIKQLGPKAYQLGHWLFDYASGEAVATTEAVAVMFDLDARKAVELPASARAALERYLVPELTA